MHHPHHHHRHQSAPRFLLVTPAGVPVYVFFFPPPKTSECRAERFSKQTREDGHGLLADAFRWEGNAERRAVRGGPALIAISALLPDYRLQPSPTIEGRGHRRPLANSSDHRGQDKNLIHLPPRLKIPACPGDLSFLINSMRRRIINVTVIYARSSNRSPFYNFIGILSASPQPQSQVPDHQPH